MSDIGICALQRKCISVLYLVVGIKVTDLYGASRHIVVDFHRGILALGIMGQAVIATRIDTFVIQVADASDIAAIDGQGARVALGWNSVDTVATDADEGDETAIDDKVAALGFGSRSVGRHCQ